MSLITDFFGWVMSPLEVFFEEKEPPSETTNAVIEEDPFELGFYEWGIIGLSIWVLGKYKPWK